MKAEHFLQALERDRIKTAIATAEKESSGQIRVSVSHRTVDDALAAARRQFASLKMEQTAARNGVLIFLAPESRKFAVVGDDGIHEKAGGDEFWQKVVGAVMRPLLQEDRFTEAIVAAVGEVGRVLAKHFPPGGEDARANELPDEVDES